MSGFTEVLEGRSFSRILANEPDDEKVQAFRLTAPSRAAAQPRLPKKA